MKKRDIYILPAALLLLSACYKDIDMEKYRPDPVIVVNSAISSDSTIMASVTHTWFYADTKPYEEHYANLPQARVDLYVNDEFREQMEWGQYLPVDSLNEVPDSVFKSHVVPKAGDCIRLVVSADGYQTVTAETTVPAIVPIRKAECVDITERINYEGNVGDGYGNTVKERYYALTYNLTFKDEGGRSNYYALTCLKTDEYYQTYYHPHIESSDPILSENSNALDGSIGFDGISTGYSFLFTDKQIEGQEYTLSFEEWVNKSDAEQSSQLLIRLYSLSEEYYHYLYSLNQVAGSTLDEALGNLGFGEPLRVYSNVEGGTGILGACNSSETEVTVQITPAS